MYNIVALGELLIDFTPIKTADGILYKQNAGGAPCNMLTMASNLGSKTAFIGKVGSDEFGVFLADVLQKHGVDISGLVIDNKYNTTLAFVHLNEQNDRSFSFYRKGCADIMLSKNDINYSLINKAQAVHFGSLSFTNEPSKFAVEEAINYAKLQGKLITYDPNYRTALWQSVACAIKGMKKGLKYADILKVSQEEAQLLTNEKDIKTAAIKLSDYGIKLICITLAEQGSFYYHKNGNAVVAGFKATVKDSTGAGDAFFGAVVHQILEQKVNLNNINNEALTKIFKYANAAASLCIESLGGIASLPTIEEVEERVYK